MENWIGAFPPTNQREVFSILGVCSKMENYSNWDYKRRVQAININL
jgi:hypothetical protein